jgi:glycosyltransferase involved in cell wall biosynthesis
VRIAINLRKFQPNEIGGIENYIRYVAGGIASDRGAGGHELTVFAQDLAVDAIRAFAPGAVLRTVPRHACGLSIDAELDRTAYDILFCPQMGLDPVASGLPSVAMIPDLAHRMVPESFDPEARVEREALVAATVKHADVILTLSNYSRDALVDMYDVDPRRIVVTYCAAGPEFHWQRSPHRPPAFSELGIPKEYLYFPANFWKHKNHQNLLRAVALLVGDHPEMQLLLTGAPSTGAERVRELIDTLGLAGNVRMLDFQPTAMAVALMRHAQAVVYPTLFEGFGIPPLEAFHVGTPVVASGTTGNLEVVGDAALLVDPDDPQSIADGVSRMLTDADLRAELVERGRQRAAHFSWPHTVDIVARALRDVQAAVARPSKRVAIREPTRVAVVTPVHENARFLVETVESVLAQEYPYIDYVVLSGASNDDTLNVLRGCSNRVRWYSRPVQTQTAAINEGYRETWGDLFAFLTPGDLYEPDTVWRVVAHYDADPDVAVVYGEASCICGHDEDASSDPVGDCEERVLDDEGQEHFICQSAAFVRRDAFARAGMLDPVHQVAYAHRLWLRIAQQGGAFMHVHHPLAITRAHTESHV